MIVDSDGVFVEGSKVCELNSLTISDRLIAGVIIYGDMKILRYCYVPMYFVGGSKRTGHFLNVRRMLA